MDTFGGFLHDALTDCEGCGQASKASPASRIFTALMKSAWADSPHFRHTKLPWVFAVICRYLTAPSPYYRAGAAGVLACRRRTKTTPPLGLVLQLTAQLERTRPGLARLSPDFWATCFPVVLRALLELHIFPYLQVSTNTSRGFC